jgi:hypothetical protein
MEQFVGTVEASAETRTFSDFDGQPETLEPEADYIRPTAAKSDYLNSASAQPPSPSGGRPSALGSRAPVGSVSHRPVRQEAATSRLNQANRSGTIAGNHDERRT